MRAIWYERPGPAREVLQFGERPRPEPAPGEVRVRLLASGVNPADIYRRAGTASSRPGTPAGSVTCPASPPSTSTGPSPCST